MSLSKVLAQAYFSIEGVMLGSSSFEVFNIVMGYKLPHLDIKIKKRPKQMYIEGRLFIPVVKHGTR